MHIRLFQSAAVHDQDAANNELSKEDDGSNNDDSNDDDDSNNSMDECVLLPYFSNEELKYLSDYDKQSMIGQLNKYQRALATKGEIHLIILLYCIERVVHLIQFAFFSRFKCRIVQTIFC